MRSVFLFFLALFFYLQPPLSALDKKIESRHVIIRSSFQEETDLPVIRSHYYDLQIPGKSQVNYSPRFSLSTYDLPENFPQDKSFHWLAGGGLAELFLGAQGVLENGILLYQKQNYAAALKKFQLVLDSPNDFHDEATLWFSWSLFQQGKLEASSRQIAPLVDTQDRTIKGEALYLSLLTAIKTDDYTNFPLLEKVSENFAVQEWDSRITYSFLIGLIHQKKWKQASTIIRQLEGKKGVHSRLLYKIKEIEGIIFYKDKSYDTALSNFLLAQKLNIDQKTKYLNERAIAWMYYYRGSDVETLKLIDRRERNFWQEYRGEIQYLKLLTLLRIQKWRAVKSTFEQLSTGSEFYERAAFLIRTNLRKGDGFPILYNQVSSLDYQSPKMRFHVSLLNGNQAFREKKFKEAQKQYLRALAVKSNDQEYHLTRYNLGLTYLHLGQYDLAKVLFQSFSQDSSITQSTWLNYHIIYLSYQSNQKDLILQQIKLILPDRLPLKNQVDLRYMLGGVYLSRNQNQQAVREFLYVWKQTHAIEALEFTIKAYYKDRQYQKILDLTKGYTEIDSKVIFSYRIRSFLGLREFKTADMEVKKRKFSGSTLIQLRMEVWLANKQYRRIIQKIPPLLRKPLPPEERVFYYLSLGDAFFNLQQFTNSKNQFYKALPLAQTAEEKSMIYYNVILSTFFSNDEISFLKELRRTLKNPEITSNIRYNLTQLLVDYHLRKKQEKQADLVLEKYIEQYSYQKSNAQLKRIKLLSKVGKQNHCFQLAQEVFPLETEFQKRDRIIVGSYCSQTTKQDEKVIQALQKELADPKIEYREHELKFLLSKAFFNVGQYQSSLAQLKQLKEVELLEAIRFQTQLLLSQNYLNLKKPTKALEALGEIKQYRKSLYYPEALLLASNIKLAQEKTNEGLRSLLRVYYLKSTPPLKKQKLLLKVVTLLLKQKQVQKAQRYFRIIKLKEVSQSPILLKKYKLLQKKVQ